MTDQDHNPYQQWLSRKRNTLPEIDVRDRVLAKIASETFAQPRRTTVMINAMPRLIAFGKAVAIAASLLVGLCRVFLFLSPFSTLQ